MDPFWYKAFVVVVLMMAQGALWAWVGSQASERLPWWPFK